MLVVLGAIALWVLSLWMERTSFLKRQRRIAELEAGFPERFLEEKRELAAYPPTRQSMFWRQALISVFMASLIGIVLTQGR